VPSVVCVVGVRRLAILRPAAAVRPPGVFGFAAPAARLAFGVFAPARLAEDRVAEVAVAEDRLAEDRLAEDVDDRLAADRLADDRFAEDRLAADRLDAPVPDVRAFVPAREDRAAP
jgi:hypothetical protein